MSGTRFTVESLMEAKLKIQRMELVDQPRILILYPGEAETAERLGLIEGRHFFRTQTIPA